MNDSRISSEIPFEQDGRHDGYLRLPYSTDRSAYGWIPIPISVIRNGDGPTLLLTAGNHGDEYEGQIAVRHVLKDIDPSDIQGRIIVCAALNAPAVQAGCRVSPLDSGNLNRSFPGDAAGTPTEMMAHYVTSELLPRSDAVIDLHSGGASLDFTPCALARYGAKSDVQSRSRELLDAFSAPISYLTSGAGGGAGQTLAAAAERSGVPAIMTELGGGGALSSVGVEIAITGIRNVLAHLGILPSRQPVIRESITLRVEGPKSYLYARSRGIFEPEFSLGDVVNEGDLAGHIHALDTPCATPEEVFFQSSGIVICRRVPASVEIGDCLGHLGVE